MLAQDNNAHVRKPQQVPPFLRPSAVMKQSLLSDYKPSKSPLRRRRGSPGSKASRLSSPAFACLDSNSNCTGKSWRFRVVPVVRNSYTMNDSSASESRVCRPKPVTLPSHLKQNQCRSSLRRCSASAVLPWRLSSHHMTIAKSLPAMAMVNYRKEIRRS